MVSCVVEQDRNRWRFSFTKQELIKYGFNPTSRNLAQDLLARIDRKKTDSDLKVIKESLEKLIFLNANLGHLSIMANGMKHYEYLKIKSKIQHRPEEATNSEQNQIATTDSKEDVFENLIKDLFPNIATDKFLDYALADGSK